MMAPPIELRKSLKSYSDPRISYTWQENQDAFNTINRGMSQARGEYISILNSDDIYTLNRLERLVEFSREKNADCVFSDVIPISDRGEQFTDPQFGWNLWHQKNRDCYKQSADIYAGFLNGNFMVTTSNLFLTAQAVQKVGQFASIRYLHDYDYIFRVMLDFPDSVYYLSEEQLLYYRIHDGNTLSEAAITGREQDLEVIEKYMLAKTTDESRRYVEMGSRRLRQLEIEIQEVKAELAMLKTGKSGQPDTRFLPRLRNKLCRIVCG